MQRIYLLVAALCAVIYGWWWVQSRMTESNEAMLVQAYEVLQTQPDLAEEMFQLALEGRSDPRVLEGLAIAQQLQGNLPSAERTAKQWTEIAPNQGAAWMQLAQIQREQNRFVRAQETLQSGIRSSQLPTDRDRLRILLVELDLLADDIAAAKANSAEFETEETKQAFASSLAAAQLQRLNGDLEQALITAQACLAKGPSPTAARMLIGLIHLDSRRFEEAVNELSAVIQAEPKNKEAHYKLAMAFRELNRTEEATEHLEISRQLTLEQERRLNGDAK